MHIAIRPAVRGDDYFTGTPAKNAQGKEKTPAKKPCVFRFGADLRGCLDGVETRGF